MREKNPSLHRRNVNALLILLLMGVAFIGVRIVVAGENDNAGETATSYSDDVSRTYDFKFGANPFAPSNATTETGKFIPAKDFIAASRCAKCHTDTHAQWLQSAHRNSFREPFYQKNVKDLIQQKGIEYTRHCEACHNPAALFSGALTKDSKIKRPFDEEGVSCIACHTIERATKRGIGGYVFGQPALLVKEDGARLLNVTDQEILNDVPSHRRAMMRPLLKTQEFCASCHKSQVPKELNDYKFLRAFSVGDEFQLSSFSKESPHPFYVRDKESCNSCHMKKQSAPKFDVSAKDGVVSSHAWASANTAIPFFYKWDDQLARVKNSLETDVVGIDIFALRRRASTSGDGNSGDIKEIIAPINRSSFQLNAGETLTADVVVTNKNIGHSFPPELRDFYEAYVEFNVSDDGGKVLYTSGFIKPDGYLDESAHTYKTFLVKADGSFNDVHYIWKTKIVAQNNQIQSGRSDVARYQFTVPKDLQGALHLKARVQYRRFTRAFSNYVLGKSINYPVVTMATAECVLKIGENAPQTAANAKGLLPDAKPAAVPDWRRWNNYGIALYDNRQFALAADVFARVAEVDEKYRLMAKVNHALALIELSRYDDAAQVLDEVIKANPPNPILSRARFQESRVLMRFGKLDEAEKDLRLVLADYPRDRISWQELGELCKIKRDYAGARHCYEQVLDIDPEDTGAHYNLMLVFRKLGMTQEARREAVIFTDQKDDPSAFPIANEFLRQRPEMSNESVPFHVHNLDAPHTHEMKSARLND